MLTYKENVKNSIELCKLYCEVGWGELEPELATKAIENTLYSISVYNQDTIIGYGRLIGDGVMFIYVQDIMVTPKYQGQGIGKTILNKLMNQVTNYQKINPEIRVYVGPDTGKEEFYRKFGFVTRKEKNLGEGMIYMLEDKLETYIYDWKEEISEAELQNIVKILDNDGIIVFPTDTVYGLACNCLSKKAINKIFEVKKRARNNPINVLTDSVDKMYQVAEKISQKEKRLIERYMPGALTIILDKKKEISDELTAGLPTVGVRIPDNNIALKILESVSYPLATTSANISGDAAGVKIEDFVDYFSGKVDAIIDGGTTQIQIASTVIRVEDDSYKVIREGSIKLSDILSEK